MFGKTSYLCKDAMNINLKHLNMRILSFLALSLVAFSVSAQSYTITGKVDAKYDGKEIYLIDDAVYIDTVQIADGAFKFDGACDDQKYFQVLIQGNKRSRVAFIVEPGRNVNIDYTAAGIPVTDNGGLNDKRAEMEKAVEAAGNAVNAKIQELQAQGKTQEEIGGLVNADIEAVYDIYRKAIEDNKNNMLGAFVLAMVAESFYPTIGELDTMIGKVKYASRLSQINKMRENLLKAEATQAGKMFIDFTALSADGKASKLSDYVGKGKYVLADFWASWCGPCKREIPNLIELQNKFGGDKFMVLGVNVWDEEDSFKAALTAEGITYPQIYVPRDNKDNATEIYGIRGIPQIILFAPDGTIVQRDLRGDAMKTLVEEKMK